MLVTAPGSIGLMNRKRFLIGNRLPCDPTARLTSSNGFARGTHPAHLLLVTALERTADPGLDQRHHQLVENRREIRRRNQRTRIRQVEFATLEWVD
jgi:hypothetical protein